MPSNLVPDPTEWYDKDFDKVNETDMVPDILERMKFSDSVIYNNDSYVSYDPDKYEPYDSEYESSKFEGRIILDTPANPQSRYGHDKSAAEMFGEIGMILNPTLVDNMGNFIRVHIPIGANTPGNGIEIRQEYRNGKYVGPVIKAYILDSGIDVTNLITIGKMPDSDPIRLLINFFPGRGNFLNKSIVEVYLQLSDQKMFV